MAADGAAEAFRLNGVTRRQMRVFREECACTRALHRLYSTRQDQLARVIVIDGSDFRWEGLGNSCTRWMGLLRWGFATDRAVFLRLSRDCRLVGKRGERPSDSNCHLDLGEYFTGWGGVDWHWGDEQEARVRRKHGQYGREEVVIRYSCAVHKPPGCAVASLHFNNGSLLRLSEPLELLHWARSSLSPDWIRLVLMQQHGLEYSYGKPEQIRTNLHQPFTTCPIDGVASWTDREKRLKCETFAFLQPRPALSRVLLPTLAKLEPFEVIVGIHLRTGYADWSTRNSNAFFSKLSRAAEVGLGSIARMNAGTVLPRLPIAMVQEARLAASIADQAPNDWGSKTRQWSMAEHWRRLDQYFDDCKSVHDGPCFNWESPRFGSPPRLTDASHCLVRPGRRWRQAHPLNLSLSVPQGFLASLVTCAIRLAESLQAVQTRESGRGRRWGLLVLSDSEAFPSLVARVPELHGRVVTTEGIGRVGHSSFTKSCAAGGCEFGPDPGGVWTRSVVDFYLAGVADGFVKALYTVMRHHLNSDHDFQSPASYLYLTVHMQRLHHLQSFLYGTMRRDLLCCKPGAFVQWQAWYNLSRSHRDRPMLDHDFMLALSTKHSPS